MRYLYWNGDPQSDHGTGISVATLSGCIVRQVVLGILADKFGRRNVYGWKLIIIMIASAAVAMLSHGLQSSDGTFSMRIKPWLVFWRFVTGIAVGAEYPVTAA